MGGAFTLVVILTMFSVDTGVSTAELAHIVVTCTVGSCGGWLTAIVRCSSSSCQSERARTSRKAEFVAPCHILD